MAMKRSAKVTASIFVILFILGLCYSIAVNYDYDALSGTYRLTQNGEKCTLFLRSDHTFTQKLVHSSSNQEVQGTWRRYGEAHVSFSKEFVTLAGEQLNEFGEAHGQFDKTLGLLPSLTLAPIPSGPTFHKVLFH